MKLLAAFIFSLILGIVGFFLYSPLLFSRPVQAVVGQLKVVNPQTVNIPSSCTFASASSTSGQSTITGSGFTSSTTCQIKVGDRVTLGSETKTVTVVADTSLTTDTAFTNTNSAVTLTVLPALLTVADSGGNVKLVVNDQGFVGIGQNSPAYRLDVGGTSSIIQNSSGNITITPASNLIVSAGYVDVSAGGLYTGGTQRISSTGVLANVSGNISLFTNDSGYSTSSLPTGAIMFFNLTACPSGWTALSAAAGRVIVGRAANESIGSTVGTALTSLEDKTHTHTGPSHTHAQNGSLGTYNSGGCSGVVAANLTGSGMGTCASSAISRYAVGTGVQADGTGATGTALTSNVIPYIQYLVCSKN